VTDPAPASDQAPVRYRRYVAVGDSTTEGIDDPDGAGGFRGWADRLAERLAATSPGLLYANLAIRGRRAAAIRSEQLATALAMEPDVATVVAGMNDVLRRHFDAVAVAAEVEAMQAALVSVGATVLTFTLPDPGSIMPLARAVQGRVRALNDALRAAAERTGAVLVDLGAYPVAGDPRLWSIDRLHANTAGHERIAAALAEALHLPGSDSSWGRPLPTAAPRPRHQTTAAELAWLRAYALPWVIRHARGRSSGDGITAKRPVLAPIGPAADAWAAPRPSAPTGAEG
jgi:lysophospholipase L1-like esterase